MAKFGIFVVIWIFGSIFCDFGNGLAKEFGKTDEKHVWEHLENLIDSTKTMTKEEKDFHYFNTHDLNKDGYIDGLELMIHYGNHDKNDEKIDGEDLEKYIDAVLEKMDQNNDGFVSYYEHRIGNS
uniref:EF-hand domain-containing protein n=1 Tax=Panagrolaimus sp. JU765 TaxID=591449 RepID=A0AC34Q2W5_9BILA